MPGHQRSGGGGAGITGERSSMWKHMARIIGEVRPRYAFVENSPMLTSRGLGVVLADLSTLGFDAKWGVVSAADIGANHLRERIWIRAEQRNILSHTEHNGFRWRQQQSESIKKTHRIISNTEHGYVPQSQLQQRTLHKKSRKASSGFGDGIGNSFWWAIEPNICRVDDGVAAKVDRIKAIGNGQVPLCAATAWELLK